MLVVVGLEEESAFEFSFSAAEESALLSEIRRILLDLPHPNQAKLSKHYELTNRDLEPVPFE